MRVHKAIQIASLASGEASVFKKMGLNNSEQIYLRQRVPLLAGPLIAQALRAEDNERIRNLEEGFRVHAKNKAGVLVLTRHDGQTQKFSIGCQLPLEYLCFLARINAKMLNVAPK